MPIKFETLKPSDVVYDKHKYKSGNSTMHKYGVWQVLVLEVDLASRRALVSWNGNKPEWRSAQRIERYYRNKPKIK